MATMKVELRRVGVSAFDVTSESGGRTLLRGSESLEARILERVADVSGLPRHESPFEARSMRPMELFLASLGGCSAMDVVLILTRQREDLRGLRVVVEGERVEATPAVFEHIHLRFETDTPIDKRKLERAVTLALGNYCSVAKMLGPEVRISHVTHTPQ